MALCSLLCRYTFTAVLSLFLHSEPLEHFFSRKLYFFPFSFMYVYIPSTISWSRMTTGDGGNGLRRRFSLFQPD